MTDPDTASYASAEQDLLLASAEADLLLASAEAIAERTGVDHHDVAVVLGSGWAPAVAELGDPVAVVPMAELPGFTPPSATGHGGQVLSVRIGAHRVLVLVGRIHAYEGHDLQHVVHPVRTSIATGVHTVVLTNAAGGLRADYQVGQPVLISDHLNLTARSPLVGAQFVDLVDAYSPRLRDIAREIDPTLTDGVYAGLPGPHYETPAEIRMLRTLGADLVGMSRLRATPPTDLAGFPVVVDDLLDRPGEQRTDALILTGGDDRTTVRVVVRPSGTEPKLKSYTEVRCAPTDDLTLARARANTLSDELIAAAALW